MLQTRCRLSFMTKTLQVRRARPLAQANDFQRNRAIETFLARPINDPLAAAADLLEQLIIAKLHLHSLRFLGVVAFVIKRSESCPKQTHAAKSVGRIREHGRAAFCAHSPGIGRFGAQSFVSLSVLLEILPEVTSAIPK